MNANRRSFLKCSAALAATASMPSVIPSASAESGPVENASADALNPSGIRVAGIRMVPVVGGKYKVWTKKMGSGPTKVLLLHGGPGFSHEDLEAMEAVM